MSGMSKETRIGKKRLGEETKKTTVGGGGWEEEVLGN